MQSNPITDIFSFLRDSAERVFKNDIVLFRGQDCDEPLLPKIARKNPASDTTVKERRMLAELRRTGGAFIPAGEDDWDLLARAQHFGMATRLLDWSTNPLAALWFACCDRDKGKPGYIYRFDPDDDQVVSKSENSDPFGAARTMVYRPHLNNARLVAQAGWFTLHRYSKPEVKFVPLEQNRNARSKLQKWSIAGELKATLLEQLDQLGVNQRTLFPDLEGVCRHLNWLHGIEKPRNAKPAPTIKAGVLAGLNSR